MSRLSCFILLLGTLIISPVQSSRAASFSAGEQPDEFVLILSAYDYDNEWSTSLAKEIQRQLHEARADLQVNITYAGITSSTPSILADRFAMQGAFSYGRLTTNRLIPNLLILIGDESWMLYRIMNLRGRWENIPVVLCGVHPEIMSRYGDYFPSHEIPDGSLIPIASSIGSFRASVVPEPDNTELTLQLVGDLHPEVTRLYYLSHGTYSDRYTRKRLEQAIARSPRPYTLTELVYNAHRTDSTHLQPARLPEGSLLLTNGIDPPYRLAPDIPVITLRDMAYNDRLPQGGYFAPIGSLAGKAADAALKSLGGATVYPQVTTLDVSLYLNRTALGHTPEERRAEQLLPHAHYRHHPPPFVVRYMRHIAAGILILILLGFILLRTVSSYRYQRNLQRLYAQNKSLYDEYQAVYENMPIGLMLFDRQGNLLQSNAAAAELLPDEELRRSVFGRDRPNRTIERDGHSYYIMSREIAAETGDNHLLFIVVDHTEIERMRKDKERIYNVFNFAMNQSGIGVASYNLIDREGFATRAWYQLLYLDEANEQHLIGRANLVPDDRRRIEHYLEEVSRGASHPFLHNIKVVASDGTPHNLRCYIKPIDYVPGEGRVTVAEIIVNVDAQVQREDELKALMEKAQESTRLKYAFVANIRDDIRLPWRNIVRFAEELAGSNDVERRKELNGQIEQNSSHLLELISQFIDASQQETLNPQTTPPA